MFNGGNLRRKLRKGQAAVGTIAYFGSPAFVEMAAAAGYDWLFLDTEHGHLTSGDLLPLLLAAKGTPIDVIVRVPGLIEAEIKRALDWGANGIVVPMVENAEQAALAAKWSKYAPLGRRGCGPLRAEYTHRVDEYFAEANDRITVVAQMESLESVRNIEEIVRVPGLDAVFMGLDDLRQSMGLLGVRDHPELDRKVDEIFRAARQAGMPFGTFVGSAEACRSWIDRGALLMTVGSDLEFWLNGLDREMERLKGTGRSGRES